MMFVVAVTIIVIFLVAVFLSFAIIAFRPIGFISEGAAAKSDSIMPIITKGNDDFLTILSMTDPVC